MLKPVAEDVGANMYRNLLAVLLLAFAAASPALAQEGRWRRAESPNFVVYSEGSESQLRAAAQSLEDLDTVLRIATGSSAPAAETKLEVYLLRGRTELNIVRPALDRQVLGFYRAGAAQIAAFAIFNNYGGLDRDVVLFHEYAHHFMLHYFPEAYPRWYVEGWAENAATVEFHGREARFGAPSEERGYSILLGGVMPIETLLAPERLEHHSQSFDILFYANAWFATAYVRSNRERSAGLQRYIQALGEGGDPIDSFEPAFGITPAAFQEELNAFKRGRVSVHTLPLPPAVTDIIVARLPRVADELLLPLARARMGVPKSQAESLAQQLEAGAAGAPGEPMARIALARAAILRDDFVSARTALDALLAQDAGHAEARFLLATTILAAAPQDDAAAMSAAFTEARRELVRSFRSNPNYFPTLYLYARVAAEMPGPMNEGDLNVLARALELAPQSQEVRFLLASQLIESEQFDAALVTLRPLLYDPHNGEAAAQAREMFTAAREHRQPELEQSDTDAEDEPQ